MGIILNAIQFIETALLFSAAFFSAIMFARTRDKLAGRTLFMLVPVATLLFISYMYNISTIYWVNRTNAEWVSPMFALMVITLVMIAILGSCYYTIQLFPIPQKKKKYGFFLSAVIVGILLIATGFLVMYISAADLTRAVTNALWAFYPLCSISLFIVAIAVAVMYKKISNPHDQSLAKYFLIAFLPQIIFSFIDFFLMRHIAFQFTHLSYTLFSLFVFLDLSQHFYKKYNADLDISTAETTIQKIFSLSDREMEVVELLAKGITNQAIGIQLHISVNTVKSHNKRIYEKMAISNRLQLVNKLNEIKTTAISK